MTHFCYFNKHILNPIKRCGYVAEGRKAMMKLKDQILDSILLRRTKLDRSDDIMLPTRCVQVRMDDMDEREADFYGALYTQSKAQFNTYVRSGTVLNNYAHIFDILIRLRQAVDHPYLVIFSNSIKDYAPSNSGITSQLPAPPEIEEVCALCHEPPDDVRKSACGHLFCHDCAADLVENAASSGSKCNCPECNKPLTLLADSDAVQGMPMDEKPPAFKSRKQSILSKIDLSKFQSSTKVEALMQV
jgi:DNA repair protein RAD16